MNKKLKTEKKKKKRGIPSRRRSSVGEDFPSCLLYMYMYTLYIFVFKVLTGGGDSGDGVARASPFSSACIVLGVRVFLFCFMHK